MDDFRKYKQMRDDGALPGGVYRAARNDGVDKVTLIRLLRRVFDLSLAQAKEVTIVASGRADALSEHQAVLIPALEDALVESHASKTHR